MRSRSGQRVLLVVDEQAHRGGELMAAGVARPDVAHARLAHELGCCRRKQEIVANGTARESEATRRNGSTVRLGRSGHGLLLRLQCLLPSVLCSPRLECCRRSLAIAWHVGEVFIK